MQDGNRKTLTRDNLFLSEPWPRRGKDRRQETHGKHDRRGKKGAGDKGSCSTRGKAKKKASPVVYVLKNAAGQVFYVGLTKYPQSRICKHRARFGKSIEFEIVQRVFRSEHPRSAERKWMERFMRKGYKLKNRQDVGWIRFSIDYPNWPLAPIR